MDYKKLSILLGSLLTVFIIAFIIVPWCCGYEVYFLSGSGFKLEEIYYVAGIIGAISTAAAVWVAILIPKKVAEEQNKISMLDKRLELYFLFRAFSDSYKIVLAKKGKSIYPDEYFSVFHLFLRKNVVDILDMSNFYICSFEKLFQISFIFPNISEQYLRSIMSLFAHPINNYYSTDIFSLITEEDYAKIEEFDQKLRKYIQF